MIGVLILVLALGILIPLLSVASKKVEDKIKAEEMRAKRDARLEKMREYNAKKTLFQIYIKFGRSWFCENNGYPLEFCKWTKKESVYSEDGVQIGYNFYITEEGIKMLKEFRGD